MNILRDNNNISSIDKGFLNKKSLAKGSEYDSPNLNSYNRLERD